MPCIQALHAQEKIVIVVKTNIKDFWCHPLHTVFLMKNIRYPVTTELPVTLEGYPLTLSFLGGMALNLEFGFGFCFIIIILIQFKTLTIYYEFFFILEPANQDNQSYLSWSQQYNFKIFYRKC